MKDSQLIAKFNFENKMFCISLTRDKKIIYSYVDNKGKVCFDLKQNENKLLVEVLKSLLVIPNRSYYVRDEKRNNKLYEIFYDPITENYFWKSNYEADDTDDNIFFNIKYNNNPEIVYDINSDSRGEKNSIWWIKFMKYVGVKEPIKIFVIGALSLTLLSSMLNLDGNVIDFTVKNDDLSKTEIIEMVDTQHKSEAIFKENKAVEDNYNWETIRQAIENNPNIGNKEKKFLYKLKFVFDEHHQYMNLDLIVNRLKKLEIVYISEPHPEYAGTYNQILNLITLYNVDSFENVDIKTFCHEFFHVLQENYRASKFLEISNTEITAETLRRLHAAGELDNFEFFNNLFGVCDYGTYNYGTYGVVTGYRQSIYIYYYLAELLPQEMLISYQYKPNDKMIVDYLCKNSSNLRKDRNLGYKLFDLITKRIEVSKEDFDAAKQADEEIYNLIKHFYELNGMTLETSVPNFEHEFIRSIDFSSKQGGFLLEILGKTSYMENDDIMMLFGDIQMKTYLSNAFPETIIYLQFKDKTTEGRSVVVFYGETGNEYTISLNGDLMKLYAEYLNPSLKVK